MILSLFRKNTATEPVYAVYRSIVAQSRQPRFYAEWGVPDTVTGRFDMISLHMALLFRRLRGRAGEKHEFSQAVFDLFFQDMDRSLREMGVTDIGVPKKIQKMGNIFFGLLAALDAAFAEGSPEAVESVLVRNVYGGQAHDGAKALAAYMMAQDTALAAESEADIVSGNLNMKVAA